MQAYLKGLQSPVTVLGQEDSLSRRDRLLTPVFLGFPGGSDGKEFPCNVGDLGLIPGLRRSPGGGHGNPLQYSGLENPHGQRSLAGYSPWGLTKSDMTEQLSTAHRETPKPYILTWVEHRGLGSEETC